MKPTHVIARELQASLKSIPPGRSADIQMSDLRAVFPERRDGDSVVTTARQIELVASRENLTVAILVDRDFARFSRK